MIFKINRKQYIVLYAIYLLFTIIFTDKIKEVDFYREYIVGTNFAFLFIFVFLSPYVAMNVARLRDAGKSVWIGIASFIPVASHIIFFYLLFCPSVNEDDNL